MADQRVIVTVDGQKARKLEDELARLKRQGLQIEQLQTTLGVTHIVGRFQGSHEELNSEGVVAEPEGWMTET